MPLAVSPEKSGASSPSRTGPEADATGNLYIGRKALRDTLFATENFRGLTGTLTCNQYGDCGAPHIAIYQVVSTDPASWNPGANPRKIYP